jgi:hypothetical protein
MEKARGEGQKAEGQGQKARGRGTARLAAHFAFCICHFALCTSLFAAKFHDTPPGGGGGITLAVQPIEELEEAIVVEATEYKIYVASIDRGAGQVSIRGLSPGKYDFMLKFRDKVFEGITLDVPGDYERLPKKARDGIKKVMWQEEDYFHIKAITRMGGSRERVKLVVEQVRTRKTFEPSGRVMAGLMIRRIDLTELRKTGQIWQIKIKRHLFREERKKGGPGTTLKFYYIPSLGNIRVGDEMVTAEAFDAAKARPGRSSHFYSARYSEKPKR